MIAFQMAVFLRRPRDPWRRRVRAMPPCRPGRAQPAFNSMPTWGQSGGMGRARSSTGANRACRTSSWRARANHGGGQTLSAQRGGAPGAPPVPGRHQAERLDIQRSGRGACADARWAALALMGDPFTMA